MTTGKNILILEDDPFMRELVALSLKDAGYDIDDTGAPRLRNLHERAAVKVIIVGLNSPKSEGKQTVDELRASFPTAHIIAISGYFQLGPGMAAAVARQLGVTRVLAKPFSCDELIAVVHETFRIGAPS
jgi:DNA-binding response OmpR family regulator